MAKKSYCTTPFNVHIFFYTNFQLLIFTDMSVHFCPNEYKFAEIKFSLLDEALL